MYMTEQQFIAGFKRMSEVCGRPITDGTTSFYWEKVKTAEAGKLAAALSLFATRGKWPTLENLMSEIGIVPPMSSRERAEYQRRQENATPPPTDRLDDMKNRYGVWVFETFDLPGQSSKANQMRAELHENGWKIDQEEVMENLEKESGDKVKTLQKVKKTRFVAQRCK